MVRPVRSKSKAMQNQYQYILEPYSGISSRYSCPACNKAQKFSRYILTETGEQLPAHVGRCDREINCGYLYTPKQYFQDNGQSLEGESKSFKTARRQQRTKPSPVSYIAPEALKKSLAGYEQNNFTSYLITLFGQEITGQLISRYYIGTSKHWNGATVFWQIDNNGRIRTGKIMLYNPDTGKRVKEPYNCITWQHSNLKLSNFNLKQCFFGEHLLRDRNKSVAIVESEKTAIIASHYWPGFIWLAIGSLTNLNAERCNVLAGRCIYLFPDLSKNGKAYALWSSKATEIQSQLSCTYFKVVDFLEQLAPASDKENGNDLADYFIKYDWRTFRKRDTQNRYVSGPLSIETFNSEKCNPQKKTYFPHVKPLQEVKAIKPDKWEQQENWEQEITELKTYFSSITLPTQPVRLNRCSEIQNVSLFIKSHFATLQGSNRKPAFLPYLDRLQELKQLLVIKSF